MDVEPVTSHIDETSRWWEMPRVSGDAYRLVDESRPEEKPEQAKDVEHRGVTLRATCRAFSSGEAQDAISVSLEKRGECRAVAFLRLPENRAELEIATE